MKNNYLLKQKNRRISLFYVVTNLLNPGLVEDGWILKSVSDPKQVCCHRDVCYHRDVCGRETSPGHLGGKESDERQMTP